MNEIKKTISFEYAGGEYLQKVRIRGTNMPMTTESDSKWVQVKAYETTVKITAEPNYGYESREAVVTLRDRFDNTIALAITQDGFTDLKLVCQTDIVIPYSYYKENKTYDVYITVYGGTTKGVKAKGLTKHIEQAWKGSEVYCDYILHIPDNINGTYTVTHADLKDFSQYCKEKGIEFNEDNLKKKITITQLTEDECTGEIILDGDKVTLNKDKEYETVMDMYDTNRIRIKKCEYKAVGRDGLVHVVSEDTVYVPSVPEWLKCKVTPGAILFAASQLNPYDKERRARLKISSPSNPNLFTVLNVVQNPLTVKS